MSDPSMIDGWGRAIAAVSGVVIGFGLSEWKAWRTRKTKHTSYWHALRAEIEFAKDRANSFLTEKIGAPLYRFPDSHFKTCYPELLADGAISPAECIALMTFYGEVETLNRGLDQAAEATDESKVLEEYGRVRLKAKRIATDGVTYAAAAAAIAAHVA